MAVIGRENCRAGSRRRDESSLESECRVGLRRAGWYLIAVQYWGSMIRTKSRTDRYKTLGFDSGWSWPELGMATLRRVDMATRHRGHELGPGQAVISGRAGHSNKTCLSSSIFPPDKELTGSIDQTTTLTLGHDGMAVWTTCSRLVHKSPLKGIDRFYVQEQKARKGSGCQLEKYCARIGPQKRYPIPSLNTRQHPSTRHPRNEPNPPH